jgi:putative peptide zinc metalloprotease protein
MPVDRPTFSESWYRVAELRPRLRSTVQVHRQHFRGQIWHVLQDPASNQFFRLNGPAYRLVAMLDGRRRVTEVWTTCNDQLGDAAPTQGETIQLLGQLYTSNLLHADLPPDAATLFERYRRRVGREIKGYLTNFLFIRLPLFDPDRFLDRWVGVFGRLFSATGMVLWLALLALGVRAIAGRGSELIQRSASILALENLWMLYVALVVVKVCHEFGHAFACKKFGRAERSGGEVHVMGVMLLVFTPLPYVDASSAWALRNKWHRVIIGTSGMMVELGIAAIAALIWANAAPGTPAYAITYNIMFIASVSSLLFNGNPLLRYDAYYVLSDLIEIPNLAGRGKQYIYYLVRRYVWGIRNVQCPAHTRGERAWMVAHGVLSTAYRIVICVGILMFVAGKFFMIGVVLAAMAVFTWVFVPVGKFFRYLTSSPELERNRGRAMATTALVLATFLVVVGLIRMPERYRIDGVVEPVEVAFVYAKSDGFVVEVVKPSGAQVQKGDVLMRARNFKLTTDLRQLRSERVRLVAERNWALAQPGGEGAAAVQAYDQQLIALAGRIAQAQTDVDNLVLRAPVSGTWIAPEIDRARGAYMKREARVGVIASPDRLLIRAVTGQQAAAAFMEEIVVKARAESRRVAIRVKGRPDIETGGRIVEILPAGTKDLPSAALGYAAGGPVLTAESDARGTKAAEHFFEIRIQPDHAGQLFSGQLVVVRAQMADAPLAVQWWRSLTRLFQRRFQL